MAKQRWRLSESQRQRMAPLLPTPKPSGRGGRPWIANRHVCEGILWVLRTGAPWGDLPSQYPSPSTCWRRLKRWEEPACG
jgi:transposase